MEGNSQVITPAIDTLSTRHSKKTHVSTKANYRFIRVLIFINSFILQNNR